MDIMIISDLLKLLVLLTGIAIVLTLMAFMVKRSMGKRTPSWITTPLSWIASHAYPLGFSVALTSLLGSLYYSNILGYDPCVLCWFQRICMYPLTIVLGIAMFTKEKGISKYVISLSVVGLVFATLHYITQMFPASALCGTLGSAASCARTYTFAYGYITIAMMAMTAFIALILLMLAARRAK